MAGETTPYNLAMPMYEFRCRACGSTFTESRPMAASMAPATCPDGHDDTTRLLDVAGVARGRSARPSSPSGPASSSGQGGCCGGGCCG